MLLVFDCNSKEIGRHPKGKEVSVLSLTAGGRPTKRPFLSTSCIRLRISGEERHPSCVFLIPILVITITGIRDHYYR